MKRLIEQRYVFRQNLIAVIGVCLSFYFAYHLMAGERSYLRLVSLNAQIATTEQQYEQAAAERTAIEEKVVMMRPGAVSKDLLEEEARRTLGYHYEGEKIIFRDVN